MGAVADAEGGTALAVVDVTTTGLAGIAIGVGAEGISRAFPVPLKGGTPLEGPLSMAYLCKTKNDPNTL